MHRNLFRPTAHISKIKCGLGPLAYVARSHEELQTAEMHHHINIEASVVTVSDINKTKHGTPLIPKSVDGVINVLECQVRVLLFFIHCTLPPSNRGRHHRQCHERIAHHSSKHRRLSVDYRSRNPVACHKSHGKILRHQNFGTEPPRRAVPKSRPHMASHADSKQHRPNVGRAPCLIPPTGGTKQETATHQRRQGRQRPRTRRRPSRPGRWLLRPRR